MEYRPTVNINNSSRLYNLNTALMEDVKDFTAVTPMNEQRIQGEMNRLEKESGRFKHRDDTHYLIYHEKYDNDNLVESLFDHGGEVSYYTTGLVPYYVIKKMAQCPVSEAVFSLRKRYTDPEIRNVQVTATATQTKIDMSVVLPDLNPYDCLFSLFDLRYNIDKVQITFPPLTEREMAKKRATYYELKEDKLYHLKTKYKWNFYQIVKEPLSKWKMNIWFVCDSQEEEDTITRWAYPNKGKKEKVDKNA